MESKFKDSFEICGKKVGKGEPCFIIAEIGLNHNGDIDIAKKLIDRAKECGVDAVKFQKRDIDSILTKQTLEQPYDKWYAFGKSYGDHRKALELSENDFIELQEYSKNKNIIFFASPWDKKSADFLESINVPLFKIASADLTNLPLIEHIAKFRKPMIISTGMSNINEVKENVDLISNYINEIILMHSVSTYPSEIKELNLRNIITLKEIFKCPVGYSGHEKGISLSEASVVLGACCIERHFTLDRTMKGPDHAASLEPQGLFKLVRDIRNIEIALGSYEKVIQERENDIRMKLAKSVASKVRIPKGLTIKREMLTVKGPGNGLSPKYIDVIPGKKALRNIEKDTIIKNNMVEINED